MTLLSTVHLRAGRSIPKKYLRLMRSARFELCMWEWPNRDRVIEVWQK